MRTATALILREMASTYGQSPGGYIWAVLQPIGMILVLSLAFSLLLRAPSLGTSFLLFYATGYLPYDMYQSLTSKIGSALNYSRPLLAYPRVTWVDAVSGRFVLNALTSLTVSAIVLTGIMVFEQFRTILNLGEIALGFAICALVGLGVGTLNCLLIGLFPIYKSLWKIVSRPMFIASGVFFIYEDMPPIAQDILWWNPILHATGLVRRGVYPTYNGSYISLEYALGFGLLALFFGVLFMGSYYRRVLER